MVRFADGRWLTLCVSSLDSKPKEGWLEITGTKGTYLFGGDTWKTMTHKHDVEVVCQGKNPPSEGWRYYQNIAEYLVNGCELIITAEWARRPVHILDLANRSAEKGASLKAKYR